MKKPRITKSILKKNKTRGLNLLDFNFNYIATERKTM